MTKTLSEQLKTVEIWDNNNETWHDYDCPEDAGTIEDYADWCIGADSDYWATVNNKDEAVRLNGWYIVDGAKFFE